MKILVLIILVSTNLLFAQSESTQPLDKKLAEIKDFKSKVLQKQKWLEDLKNEIESYDHEKMIKKDSAQLQKSLDIISNSIDAIKAKKDVFFVTKISKQIKKIKEVQKSVFDYENKIKTKTDISSKPSNSKRLNKFIKLIDEKKYTQASAMKGLLFGNEKLLAKEYENNTLELIRDENLHKGNQKKLKDLYQKINRTIGFADESIKVVKDSFQTGKQQQQLFSQIKDAHQKPQFDVTIGEFESGLFNCKENSEAKFIRYKNFPNFIGLVTKGNVKSILNVDPNKPNKKDFIYACKKSSVLGGCLENRKKEICKIQDNCAQKLSIMEESFDLDEQFNLYKEDYIIKKASETKKSILEDPANPIYFWKERQLLGDIKVDDLLEKVDEYANYASQYKDMSVKKLYEHMSAKIKKDKKIKLTKYKNKPEYRVYEYFYNSMNNFFENLLNEDKLQEFVGKKCTDSDFCTKYKDWNEATKVFDDTEEVENLTMDECPRLVLRFDENQTVQSQYSCHKKTLENFGAQSVIELNRDSELILEKINKN